MCSQRFAHFFLALLIFFGIGLLTPSFTYGQALLDTPDPAFYQYDHVGPVIAQESPLPNQGRVRVSVITFPSPVTTLFAVNNTVTGYLFMPPTPGPHPVMLVLHEWLPPNLANENRLAHIIADADIAAFLIVQPYSLNRRPVPHNPNAELLSGNVPQMVGSLRQSILDDRRALDWLSQRPDIDPSRMGVTGISLGGILAPLLAGVDHRARIVLTLVGGADVAEIVWTTPMLRGLQQSMNDHNFGYRYLQQAMDPLESSRWLRNFPPENALQFNGRYDIFVTPKNAESLSRALGGDPIIWSNTGHYGLALSEREAETIGVKFLRSRFFADAPEFHAPSTLRSQTIKAGLLVGGQEGASPVIADQILDIDEAGRFSLDGQLTLHGLSGALSARVADLISVGLELPVFHGRVKSRTFLMFNVVL